ncbi:MAG: hypothetical protein KJ804_06065 [Proteobacteria bacterium]|nr:hypothetical protein [Pseudomonadota bacterium]
MARPLTHTKKDGSLYTRSSVVEAQIDTTVQLSQSDLQARLLIIDRNDPGYLVSECLVHLVRKGRRSDDQKLMYAVLLVLLGRCEANLLNKIPDGRVPDAANIREKILEDLTDLFVTDGTGDIPDELDFYECRFNLAFRALRIDAIRRNIRLCNHSIVEVDLQPPDATGEPDSYEDTFRRGSENFEVLQMHELRAIRQPLIKAIEDLPDDERKAVILVHVLGYEVESEDPVKESAATLCNCTGRTIRYRLTRAASKLSRFKEEL